MTQREFAQPPCEIRFFDSAEELAEVAARDWLEWLQVMTLAGREATVALSGGRIAERFFNASADALAADPTSVDRVHFFWGDERCVPPDHKDSNYRLAAQHLLKPLGIQENCIHRIPGEFGAELAATTAARGLLKWTGTDAGTIPSLDLVFLGMGEDGHVASLFPGEPVEVVNSADWFRPVTAPKPPASRVTASYELLAHAENVWVLVSGDGKEEALRKSLDGAASTPFGLLLGSRTSTRIYTDLSPPAVSDA
jgi:6-phosphogluconolactonase